MFKNYKSLKKLNKSKKILFTMFYFLNFINNNFFFSTSYENSITTKEIENSQSAHQDGETNLPPNSIQLNRLNNLIIIKFNNQNLIIDLNHPFIQNILLNTFNNQNLIIDLNHPFIQNILRNTFNNQNLFIDLNDPFIQNILLNTFNNQSLIINLNHPFIQNILQNTFNNQNLIIDFNDPFIQNILRNTLFSQEITPFLEYSLQKTSIVTFYTPIVNENLLLENFLLQETLKNFIPLLDSILHLHQNKLELKKSKYYKEIIFHYQKYVQKEADIINSSLENNKSESQDSKSESQDSEIEYIRTENLDIFDKPEVVSDIYVNDNEFEFVNQDSSFELLTKDNLSQKFSLIDIFDLIPEKPRTQSKDKSEKTSGYSIVSDNKPNNYSYSLLTNFIKKLNKSLDDIHIYPQQLKNNKLILKNEIQSELNKELSFDDITYFSKKDQSEKFNYKRLLDESSQSSLSLNQSYPQDPLLYYRLISQNAQHIQEFNNPFSIDSLEIKNLTKQGDSIPFYSNIQTEQQYDNLKISIISSTSNQQSKQQTDPNFPPKQGNSTKHVLPEAAENEKLKQNYTNNPFAPTQQYREEQTVTQNANFPPTQGDSKKHVLPEAAENEKLKQNYTNNPFPPTQEIKIETSYKNPIIISCIILLIIGAIANKKKIIKILKKSQEKQAIEIKEG